MTGPSDRHGADRQDWLHDLYAERFALHPEYRESGKERRRPDDYPPVTEQESLRHRREAVAEFYGSRKNNEETE